MLVALFVTSACNRSIQSQPIVVDSDATVRGKVLEVDPTPMYVDGDGIVRIETGVGDVIHVMVAARMNLCEAKGLELFGEIEPGDVIEAHGWAFEADRVAPCRSETHYLRIIE